jgi:transglutaminase-like putative cysteine protease
MKKCPLLMIPSLLLSLLSDAQLPSLNVASIPDSLTKNASVVKRYENSFFEITDIDRAYLKTHEVYTILNPDGANKLFIVEPYDNKFFFLENVEIKVYDAAGKQINKYKKKDMMTYGGSDDLINDNKNAYIRIPAPSYPITIETEVERKYKGSLFLPSYDIIVPDECVQQSSFTVKVPKSLDLRYKEQEIKLSPKVTEDDKYKTYVWSVNNLPAIQTEPGAVNPENLYPRILLAANRFKMDDYEGDMSTWKSLGLWFNELHKGVDVLPEDRQAFFKNLVKDAKDDREKVRIIYDYLQKNFRYVSIQLGIGGWKSLPATFTDQKKYGDCKGLTNYMHAALKTVGVRSHRAFVNSQYDMAPSDPNFPTARFNHVILCVPQPKDSIWLECTNKVIDFGTLGSSTENRNALLITEEGGVLVPTPKSVATANKFNVLTTIVIQPDGSGKVVSKFNTTGYFKMMIDYVANEKKDDQKDFIINYMGYKQPDEFVFARKEDPANMLAELEMVLEKIPEFIAGNKMFLSPRQYKLSETKLPKADKRKLDYYFKNPYVKMDTTVIKLPDGFAIDALPQSKDIKCALASYQTKFWYDEGQKAIFSTTSLTLNQMQIPASEYASVKKFFDDVALDDAQRIVIKKQ